MKGTDIKVHIMALKNSKLQKIMIAHFYMLSKTAVTTKSAEA